MKKKVYTQSLIAILLFLFLTAFSFYATAQDGFSAETKLQLQKVIDSFQHHSDLPFVGGISAAIKVEGLARWQGVAGFAARNVDEENNLLPGGTYFTKNTLSRIYSITKTFTAVLTLELAKEGVFDLNDSVGKFIPLQAINPALNGKVKIKQLLAHQSGYSDYPNEMNLQIAVAAQPTRIWTPYEILSFVHQINKPGKVQSYSSTNYVVLGAIIENATGKHVEDFFRNRFFKPLGLKSMYLDIREQNNGRGPLAAPHDNISAFNPIFLATGQPTFPDAYTNISRFPFTAISSLEFTSGGIISTAKDVTEWGSALFGGRATSKAVLNKMLNSISSVPDKDGDRLGYGIFISGNMSKTETFIGHDGNAPGYRSVMFYQPDKKLTLTVLTNFHGADIYAIARALYAAIPNFKCGEKKDDNIQICLNGFSACLPRNFASLAITYTDAKLCSCNNSTVKNGTSSNAEADKIIGDENVLTVSPNPFNTNVSFTIKIAKAGPASLELYDMNGKLISSLFKGFAEKGRIIKADLNKADLSSGIYIARLITAGGIVEKKVVKIK
ncbi:MAG: serine hydrolase [Ilyomonas sp.]